MDVFYVGNKGAYDKMVRSVLRELVQKYAHIHYAAVLERMPGKRDEDIPEDYSDTMLPEGIEEVPPRFAIVWRNKWMLRQSEYVVTYFTHSWGGAARHSSRKWRKGKEE